MADSERKDAAELLFSSWTRLYSNAFYEVNAYVAGPETQLSFFLTLPNIQQKNVPDHTFLPPVISAP